MITDLALFRSPVIHFLTRSLTVGALSTAGLLLGVVPILSHGAGFGVSYWVYAQDAPQFSEQDLENYVRAAEAIERRRQNVLAEIKGMTGSIPSIRCDRPNTLTDLPNDARTVAVDYCNWAIGIVEENNLGIDEFNAIMTASQSDEDVARRIRCIQQPSEACTQ
jgi:hypothetical protein